MKTLLTMIFLVPSLLQADGGDLSDQSQNASNGQISILSPLEDVIEEHTPFSNVTILSINVIDGDTYKLKLLRDDHQGVQQESSCHVLFSFYTKEGPAAVSLKGCFVELNNCTPIRKISLDDGSTGPVECQE